MNKDAPRRLVAAIAVALLALLVGAGGWALRAAPAARPAADQAAASPTAAPPAKALTVTPGKATVGQRVQATAEDLPPGTAITLAWQSVEGGWVVEDYYRFRGKKYTEHSVSLGTATVGPDGRLAATLTIPEDFGGVHDIVASAGGVALAQGGVELTQTFEMTPSEGPIGTLVELRVRGLGWRTMESTWVVNWDNQAVGWVSAAATRGSAVARFRATGPVGDHIIKVYSGYMGQSYLNYEQAPTAYLPRPQFTFRTTPGGIVPAAYAEPYQAQPVPSSEGDAGASLAISPTQGPVLTPTTLRGSGLPANRTLSLVWQTWVGSRVSGNGYEPREKELGTMTVGADGRLEVPVTIPDDLGGLHGIVLREGTTDLARTYFVIETSIVSISPTSGPVGTTITIHLKGVGWTEYDNIYVANYDNAYMGYACGFNSQGDVKITFAATGAPGVHLIDLYPGIYQGPTEGQQLYRLPQLTYADDHPGNKIPALRFAFEVTR
jgi:hypothetical protein